ncbi:CHAT domain-containing protein [Lactarius quietus]|nr:CHAT domain-containing protein [Lactarius quietus]
MSSSIPSQTSTPSSNFKAVLDTALNEYKEKTGKDLLNHPLAAEVQRCDSVDAILAIFQGQAMSLKQFKAGDQGLMQWISPVVDILFKFSETLGGIASVAFPPAGAIFSGISVLLTAAKDVRASHDALVELFERIESFFKRLGVYTQTSLTAEMAEVFVKIVAEVLCIISIATKEMTRKRANIYFRKLLGRADIEDALKRLDNLIQEEVQMAIAQTMKATLDLKQDAKKASDERDEIKWNQIDQDVRKWLSPPDPSTNHNTACEVYHKESPSWLFGTGMFKDWMLNRSLLWVHGKPGSGKTIVCSAVIQHMMTLRDAGMVILAYFYFDFRDEEKQNVRNFVTSLLVQLSAYSRPCCNIIHQLYSKSMKGMQQPSNGSLVECLKDMLKIPDQLPIFIIADALDECPDSGMPTAREVVLNLVKDLVHLRLPNVHLCVTSRPEVDIQTKLKPLAVYAVSLHDESRQKMDIANFISSVVSSDERMRKWRDEDKRLVVKDLSERADGMFQWVSCQLETLRHAVQPDVRGILDELPKTLDETYERILKNIHEKNRKHACRLLHCLAVSVRPLRVEELAEVLTFDFERAQGGIPKFHAHRRLDDQEGAVLSTCSSLIAVVDDHDSRVVQFSHLSVKEFLTSDHLSSSTGELSLYHILPVPAHTVLAQVCLGLLLHLDDYNSDSIRASPLAEYAARYWTTHARFEDVALHVMAGIKSLFDEEKPHFATWIGLFGIGAETGWRTSSETSCHGAMGGIRDLVLHLGVKHPQHANTLRIHAMKRFRQYSLVSGFLTASTAEMNPYNAIPQKSLPLYAQSHFEYVLDVHALTMAQLDRYISSEQQEDLDTAILLPTVSGVRPSLYIVQLLLCLALALLHRSKKFKQPEDVKISIEYLRYLRGLPLYSSGVFRNLTTTSLIRALAIQVKLEAGHGRHNIEEMVVLCHDLLTSGLSAGFPVAAFTSLNEAVNSEFIRGRVPSIDQVIECLRDATKIFPPGLHLIMFALSNTLYIRFTETYSNNDYEEAEALLERILDPDQLGRCPEAIKDLASSLATILASARSAIFRLPEYSEASISRLRALLGSSSLNEELRLQFANILAFQVRERFTHYHLAENLEEAKAHTSEVTYSTTELQQKIQHLTELLSYIPPGTKRYQECLSHLSNYYKSKFSRTNDIWDIEKSIEYCRLSLDATHPNYLMRSNSLISLRDTLLVALKSTMKITYLDESIIVGYHILELNNARHIRFGATMELALSLLTRWLFGRRNDSHEAIRLMSLAIDDHHAQVPDQFQLSCSWALLARITSHSSALTAYKTAMALLQKSLRFAPTASIQYARLVAMGENCHNMPLDYASLQIDSGRLKRPLKHWSKANINLDEMRGLRTPVSQLIDATHQLLALTTSITPLTDPFGRLVVRQRKLVEERDALYHKSKPTRLRDELVEARNYHGLDSDEYQDALSPVIEKFRELGVPEQSRIWWCPTSVFWSLPLHAMGPIPSSDSRERYFSDLYIPSYTPSLSALLESRRGSPWVLEPPSLLLVAAGDYLPDVTKEIKVIQKQARKARIGVAVTRLVSSQATPLSVLEGLRDSRFAHFACDGVSGAGQPFNASLILHEGSRLTLLDIVRSQFPDAEFAFLSTCNSADLTEESVADEVLHLTAAMQYCGFRSVVGTMWEMAETDGRDLARNFYKSLFTSQEGGVPYYQRSAEALRDATQKLRHKRGITLERWVNYVHYGA